MGQPGGRSTRTLAAGHSGPAARPVTVLVADHHAVFRAALTELIAATAGFEHVADATSVAEAVRLAGVLRPDLALLDEDLPEEGGQEAVRRIRAVAPRSVAVVMSLDREPETGLADATPRLSKQQCSPRALQRLWARSRKGPRPPPARESRS